MAVANAQNASKSNLCVSTHIGRKEDDVGTLLMTIEDIKSKIQSAKPGEMIESGVLECGDLELSLWIYPNGVSDMHKGHISLTVDVVGHEKRQWKQIESFGAENSTGAFLVTVSTVLEKLSRNKAFVNGVTMVRFLSHEMIRADENSAFFPNGVLSVQVNITVQGEETVTVKTSKLPEESITPFQLKGELSGHLRQMMERHQFSDFRIICLIIPCHRNMLAARSDIFEAMFEHNMKESQTSQVEIEDFDLETIKAVVLYIYTGEVKYNEEKVEKMIRAADKYQLHGLKKKTEDTLVKTIKIENAIDMFVLGDAVHANKLRDVSKEFIVMNAVAIVKIDGWKEKLGRFHDLAMEILESVVNSKDQNKE